MSRGSCFQTVHLVELRATTQDAQCICKSLIVPIYMKYVFYTECDDTSSTTQLKVCVGHLSGNVIAC